MKSRFHVIKKSFVQMNNLTHPHQNIVRYILISGNDTQAALTCQISALTLCDLQNSI